jgi:hypothetical protein
VSLFECAQHGLCILLRRKESSTAPHSALKNTPHPHPPPPKNAPQGKAGLPCGTARPAVIRPATTFSPCSRTSRATAAPWTVPAATGGTTAARRSTRCTLRASARGASGEPPFFCLFRVGNT